MKDLLTRDQFLANRRTWKFYARTKPEGSGAYLLLWTLLREKDVFKAFLPLSTPRKIENYATNQGRGPHYRLEAHLNTVSHWLKRLRDIKAFQDAPSTVSWAIKAFSDKSPNHILLTTNTSIHMDGITIRYPQEVTADGVDTVCLYVSDDLIVALQERIKEIQSQI